MSQSPAKAAASSSSTSSFQAIFQAALKSYQKQTKKDLLTHPLTSQLQSCKSTAANGNMASCPLTTTIASWRSERSPSPGDASMPSAPPTPPPVTRVGTPKGGRKIQQALPEDVDLSVFDILNVFCCRWFLSRSHLLSNAISAQKAEDGKITWVEFAPSFHSHLVKCAVALVPRPIPWVKKVMFVFVLEVLNREAHEAFFELRKGGRKANNAQKEKRRLARKRSRAAKREREREAAKAAHLPPRERECLTCGRKFQSRKTVKKHKCSKSSKVVRKKEADAYGPGSHPVLSAQLIKPAASITPLAPTAPSHSGAVPPVTGDLGVPPELSHFLQPPLDDTLTAMPSTEQIMTLMKKMTGAPMKYRAFQVRWQLLQEKMCEAERREDHKRPGKRRRQ